MAFYLTIHPTNLSKLGSSSLQRSLSSPWLLLLLVFIMHAEKRMRRIFSSNLENGRLAYFQCYHCTADNSDWSALTDSQSARWLWICIYVSQHERKRHALSSLYKGNPFFYFIYLLLLFIICWISCRALRRVAVVTGTIIQLCSAWNETAWPTCIVCVLVVSLSYRFPLYSKTSKKYMV